jgi:hypothetical protein
MTLHHQALRYAINSNAKQIFKKIDIASKSTLQAADFGKI